MVGVGVGVGHQAIFLSLPLYALLSRTVTVERSLSPSLAGFRLSTAKQSTSAKLGSPPRPPLCSLEK